MHGDKSPTDHQQVASGALIMSVDKAGALFDAGVEVVARIPCEALPTPHSHAYLQAKKEKLGHTLTLHMESPA